MENFALTMTFLLIGLALKRLPDFPPQTGNVLNLFVIYISLPALVLLKIPGLVFSKNLLVPALMPWCLLFFTAGLILLLSGLLRWQREITGCLLLLIPLGNTSFLGLPMVKAFFGDQAVSYALIYDQLGSFPALATYGSLVLAFLGAGNNKPTLASVALKIASFPPFIALIAALFIRYTPYYPHTLGFLNILAATLVPLVMIAVGFQLQLQLDRKLTSKLCLGLLIKLVLAPAAALLFCNMIGLRGEAVRVSIFEAGMPPMVSAGALAIFAGLSPALAAALVGAGIVLSFATLPVLYQLL
ncbi:MAG: AEC family transporter [Thermodesulfobacteriota bacterium]